MSSTPFGEHLKRERELRGVSLEEVAAATRISTRFLEALESGRWNQLPGGAFNRGFIRSASRFLGLDEESMVAEYALETDSPQDRASAEPGGAMPRDWRPVAAIAFVLALVIGIGWLVYHGISVHRRSARIATLIPRPDTPATVTSAAAASLPNEDPAEDGSATKPGNRQTSPLASLDALQLRMEATRTVNVKVAADGKAVFKGRMHESSVKTFQARDSFEVTVSDPSAVKAELNGQLVQFAGVPGHRPSLTLTRKDLKAAATASH